MVWGLPVFLISVMILPWFLTHCVCVLLIDKIESRFMAPVDFVAALIMRILRLEINENDLYFLCDHYSTMKRCLH